MKSTAPLQHFPPQAWPYILMLPIKRFPKRHTMNELAMGFWNEQLGMI